MSQARPRLLKRLKTVAAEPQRVGRLLRHAQRVVEPADRLDRTEALEKAVARPPEDQHHAAVVAARAPEEIALVGADRGRQTKRLAEHVDRGRLAEKYRAFAVLRRQRLIGCADGSREFGPAEHVSEILR